MNSDPLFQLKQVFRKYKAQGGKEFYAVDGVDLELKRGVAYALVGESGSGKTTLGRLLAGMISPTEGSIFFEDRKLGDWVRKSREKFCRKVQVVFQNPYLSLDPMWSVREILEEGIRGMRGSERRRKVQAMLDRVYLPAGYLDKKPQALSGGERQRVAIARALLVEPEFLILDEPTSQLDVSTQAEILGLIKELRPSLRGGLLFITHDLAVASHVAERFIVMHQGKVVESGLKAEILLSCRHPYTQKLLSSIPAWPPIF